jgi:hypothetical protein
MYLLIGFFSLAGYRMASAAVLMENVVSGGEFDSVFTGPSTYNVYTAINSGVIDGYYVILSRPAPSPFILQPASQHIKDVTTNSATSTCGVTVIGAPVGRFFVSCGGISVNAGDQIAVSFDGGNPDFYFLSDSTNVNPYIQIVDADGVDPILGTGTHFITTVPANAATVPTTTPIGASLYANIGDFINAGVGYGRLHITLTQHSAFACMNSGALFDAINNCAGENIPRNPITLDLATTSVDGITSGVYNLQQNVTFTGPGRWDMLAEIQQISQPWYYFGLKSVYTTIVSTSSYLVIGYKTPMDHVQEQVASSTAAINRLTQQGIGAILASTTASLKSACNIISTGFSIGDCLTLIVWPGDSAISDDFEIVKELPPWGYVFRFIDILNATTSSTTLPTIAYTFASSSPLAGIDIHFDPFGSIAQAGTLINQMTSDRTDHQTVWQIMMPIVNIFVYLVLAFMIIHDLTGIHKHASSERHKDRNEKV